MDNKKPRSSAGAKRTGGGAYGKKPGGGKPQGRFGKPGGKPGGSKSVGSKPRGARPQAGGKPKFRSESGAYGASESEGGSYKRTGGSQGNKRYRDDSEKKPYQGRSGNKFGSSGDSGAKKYGRSSEGGYEERKKYGRSSAGGYEERSPRGNSSEGGYEQRQARGRSSAGGYEERAPRGRSTSGGYEERKSRERSYETRSQGRPGSRPSGGRFGARDGDEERSGGRYERSQRDDIASQDPNLVFLKLNISEDLVQRAKELAADNEMSLTDFLPKLFEVAVNTLERAAYRKRTYVTEAASQNRKSIKTWRPKEE